MEKIILKMKDRKYISELVENMPPELNLSVFEENAEKFISSINNSKMKKNRGNNYKLLELGTESRKHLESCINFINSFIDLDTNKYVGEEVEQKIEKKDEEGKVIGEIITKTRINEEKHKEYIENLGRWLSGLDAQEEQIGTRTIAGKSIGGANFTKNETTLIGFLASLESGFDNVICQSLSNAKFLFNQDFKKEKNKIIIELEKNKDLFGWFLFRELLKSMWVFGGFTRKGEYTQRVLPMFPRNPRVKTYPREENSEGSEQEGTEQEFTISDPFADGGEDENAEPYQQSESL